MNTYSLIYTLLLLLLLFTKSFLHVSAQLIRFLPADDAVCAEICSRHLVNNIYIYVYGTVCVHLVGLLLCHQSVFSR